MCAALPLVADTACVPNCVASAALVRPDVVVIGEDEAMLISVGHGTLDRHGLSELFRTADIDAIVDIRRFPGSRRNPDVGADAMSQWVPAGGMDYLPELRLGGRRRLPAGEPVQDTWWRVPQFAAYAAHTRTEEFADALGELLARSAWSRVAMMCSESLWWRCHRRLVADVATVRFGVPVHHLAHDGKLSAHPPAAGARLRDGMMVWDGERSP